MDPSLHVSQARPTVEDIIEWCNDEAFMRGGWKPDNDLFAKTYINPALFGYHTDSGSPGPEVKSSSFASIRDQETREEIIKRFPEVVIEAHSMVDKLLLQNDLASEIETHQNDLPGKLMVLYNQNKPDPEPIHKRMFYLLRRSRTYSSVQPFGFVDWFPLWFPKNEVWDEIESRFDEYARKDSATPMEVWESRIWVVRWSSAMANRIWPA